MATHLSLNLDAYAAGLRFSDREGVIPKSLKQAAIERADAIYEVGVEVDLGVKSYWAYLRTGFTNTHLECGTIHERRAADAIYQIKHCIQPVSSVFTQEVTP
jgi:hypothetical protein